MNRFRKILLGILAFLPLMCVLSFPVASLAFFLLIDPLRWHTLSFPAIIAFLCPVLLAFISFFLDLARHEELSSRDKWVWRLLLLLGNAFAFPVYWYFMVWRTGEARQVTDEYLNTIGMPGERQFCYFSTPEHVKSFTGKFLYIYTGKGYITLSPTGLLIEYGPLQQVVPIADIAKIQIGQYSPWAKPIELDYLDIVLSEQEGERRILLTPTISALTAATETNRIVRRWNTVLLDRMDRAEQEPMGG